MILGLLRFLDVNLEKLFIDQRITQVTIETLLFRVGCLYSLNTGLPVEDPRLRAR